METRNPTLLILYNKKHYTIRNTTQYVDAKSYSLLMFYNTLMLHNTMRKEMSQIMSDRIIKRTSVLLKNSQRKNLAFPDKK